MVQRVGRLDGVVGNGDLGGAVSLRGADLAAVCGERKAFFGVGGDDFQQLRAADGAVVLRGLDKQGVDVCPALAV